MRSPDFEWSTKSHDLPNKTGLQPVALKIIGNISTQFGQRLKLKSVEKIFQAENENMVASARF